MRKTALPASKQSSLIELRVEMGKTSVLRAVPVGDWAFSYIKRRIAVASGYIKVLLNRCDLQEGKAFVYAPHGVADERVRELERGGVVEGSIRSDGSIEFSMVPVKVLARYLLKQLHRNAPAIILAEELLCRPTDPCVEQISSSIHVVHDGGLYYYARDGASLSRVEEVIRHVDLAYPPALLLLVAMPKIREEATISSILPLLHSSGEIRFVVTGVYDGESFLVWSRRRVIKSPEKDIV